MKPLHIALTSALFLIMPLSASADNCSWTHSSVPSGGATANVTYSCDINGTTAAIKTVMTRAAHPSGCTISLTNGYYNSGSCQTPNITTSNPCTNSGALYGVFWASEMSNHSSGIQAFCGSCGYSTVPIWQPQGGEPQLRVTCN